MKKYIISTPLGTGFANTILGFEISLAISYITDRTLIVPDILHNGDRSESGAKGSVWDVLDKSALANEFDVEFVKENPSLRGLDFIMLDNMFNSNRCYFNSRKITDKKDFENFTKGRPTSDTDFDDTYIVHYSFGHFYYNVYAGTAAQRNELKRKINSALRYKKEYVDMARQAVPYKFNAIHVRYPWFQQGDWPDIVNIRDNPELLHAQILKLYDKETPLYIATDLHTSGLLYDPPRYVDKDIYLNPIRKNYKIITFADLGLCLNDTEEIAVEQLICSMAEKFYGTYYSTFSKRINIMRGIAGLQADDHMGWNKIQDFPFDLTSPWPWINLKDGFWQWHASSHLQYTFEPV